MCILKSFAGTTSAVSVVFCTSFHFCAYKCLFPEQSYPLPYPRVDGRVSGSEEGGNSFEQAKPEGLVYEKTCNGCCRKLAVTQEDPRVAHCTKYFHIPEVV